MRSVVATAALFALTWPEPVDAHTRSSATVDWVAGADAPTIGLIGDSTLAGIRWADELGDLEQFNFLLDAESCRRTIEQSCWSREQYRPTNAITALEANGDRWGRILVMMTGYNDSGSRFAEGVDAIVDQARRQGVESVLWLSLRTRGIAYEEPLHLANGDTYRDANRSLYAVAARSSGYVQIADWASFSADHPEWFAADGAHLSSAGADALTAFIAAQVNVVLGGGTVTPDPPPWEDVRQGDVGEVVEDVQLALREAGTEQVGVVDGEFGPRTVAAVRALQRRAGLADTGTVDVATAIRLGLHSPPTSSTSTSMEPSTTSPATTATRERASVGADRSGDWTWWVLPVVLLAVVASASLARRHPLRPGAGRARTAHVPAWPRRPPPTTAGERPSVEPMSPYDQDGEIADVPTPARRVEGVGSAVASRPG